MKRKRVALIVQRYGIEVNGGAELHARWLAEHLSCHAEVHVVTTCAVDYTTWADYYPPGEERLNGVLVHRFSVDSPRDWRKSQKRTGELLLKKHSSFDEIEWVKEQGPYSSSLLDFVKDSHSYFDAFIFFTFLYATTVFGLPLVSDKAILVPTAHDDELLHLPVFRPIFHMPQAIVFNTEQERQLVNRVAEFPSNRQVVTGVGIDVPSDASPTRFREKHKISGRFLLYVGRVDQSKNVPELLEFFTRFQEDFEESLNLVLMGKPHLELPSRSDIIHVGFLPEQEKFDALSAAELVIVPSLYESLSMIALEAWLMQRPTLVNGLCQVLKHQTRRSNGGLYYTSYDEFEATLRLLLSSAELREQLGRNGKEFVVQNYHWDIIIERYLQLLQQIGSSTS